MLFSSCKEEINEARYDPEKAGAEIINSVKISGWPVYSTLKNSDVTFDESRIFVRQNNVLYIFEKTKDGIRRMTHFGLLAPVFSSYNAPIGMALFSMVLLIPCYNHNKLIYDIVITLGNSIYKQISLEDIGINIPEDVWRTSLNIGKNQDDNTLWIWITYYDNKENIYSKYYVYEFNYIYYSEILFNKLSETQIDKPLNLYSTAINGTKLWYYNQDNRDSNNISDIQKIFLCDLNDISNILKTINLDYLGIQDAEIGGIAFDGTYLWVIIGDMLYQLKPY